MLQEHPQQVNHFGWNYAALCEPLYSQYLYVEKISLAAENLIFFNTEARNIWSCKEDYRNTIAPKAGKCTFNL